MRERARWSGSAEASAASGEQTGTLPVEQPFDVRRLQQRDAQGGTLRIVLNWTEELKQLPASGGAR